MNWVVFFYNILLVLYDVLKAKLKFEDWGNQIFWWSSWLFCVVHVSKMFNVSHFIVSVTMLCHEFRGVWRKQFLSKHGRWAIKLRAGGVLLEPPRRKSPLTRIQGLPFKLALTNLLMPLDLPLVQEVFTLVFSHNTKYWSLCCSLSWIGFIFFKIC